MPFSCSSSVWTKNQEPCFFISYFAAIVIRHLCGDMWGGCTIWLFELRLHPMQVHGWLDWLLFACGTGDCMGCQWCNISDTDWWSSWDPLPPWYCEHSFCVVVRVTNTYPSDNFVIILNQKNSKLMWSSQDEGQLQKYDSYFEGHKEEQKAAFAQLKIWESAETLVAFFVSTHIDLVAKQLLLWSILGVWMSTLLNEDWGASISIGCEVVRGK